MPKFLIFAPQYNENVGGVICLHRLCHELNQIEGVSAALTPFFHTYEIHQRSMLGPIARVTKKRLGSVKRYRTHPMFDTPVIRRPGTGEELDEYIAIYPEAVSGNPLDATKVVRWLLYPPGGITGRVHFGTGELYVPYDNTIGELTIPGSLTARDYMKIVYYPLDLYYPPADGSIRSGVAYAVRKGSGKLLREHPEGAICIDGRGHREVADIFRRVKTFVSYDAYTAYSLFAALSGCDSVVIPDEGVDKEQWYPDPADRYGLAYGWDQVSHARSTRHLVRERMLAEQGRNPQQALQFVRSVTQFFRQ